MIRPGVYANSYLCERNWKNDRFVDLYTIFILCTFFLIIFFLSNLLTFYFLSPRNSSSYQEQDISTYVEKIKRSMKLCSSIILSDLELSYSMSRGFQIYTYITQTFKNTFCIIRTKISSIETLARALCTCVSGKRLTRTIPNE